MKVELIKDLKIFYKRIIIIAAGLLNTFIGFQACPLLVSSSSSFMVFLGIGIMLFIIIPIYYILYKLFIGDKENEK